MEAVRLILDAEPRATGGVTLGTHVRGTLCDLHMIPYDLNVSPEIKKGWCCPSAAGSLSVGGGIGVTSVAFGGSITSGAEAAAAEAGLLQAAAAAGADLAGIAGQLM